VGSASSTPNGFGVTGYGHISGVGVGGTTTGTLPFVSGGAGVVGFSSSTGVGAVGSSTGAVLGTANTGVAGFGGNSGGGIGVYGSGATGVQGSSTSGVGVWGESTGSSGGADGVHGVAHGPASGVTGVNTDATGVGLWGQNTAGGIAGYFVGTVVVTTLGSAGPTPLCINSTSQIATCSSSLRYKTDVQPFSGGLDIVKRLRPIAFTWKHGGTHDIGLAAEDVEQVEPRLTFTNDKGQIEGVKYNQLPLCL
jgi:hypothetical protein